MSSVGEAAQQLQTAVMSAVRVYPDPGASIDPPAAVIGPPQLSWSTFATEPTQATFLVHVIVAADDRALPALWDLVPAVSAAIAGATPDRFVVQRAEPSVWSAGGADLPAYLVTVDTTLI